MVSTCYFSLGQKLHVETVDKKGKKRFGKNLFAEREPFLTVLVNGFYMQFSSCRKTRPKNACRNRPRQIQPFYAKAVINLNVPFFTDNSNHTLSFNRFTICWQLESYSNGWYYCVYVHITRRLCDAICKWTNIYLPPASVHSSK